MIPKIVALFLLSLSPVFAQGAQQPPAAAPARASVGGDWTIYLELQQRAMFRGSLEQQGAKLAGFMGNETAEYAVTGSVEGTQMKLVWSIYDGGDKVEIAVTGTFDREALTGTAKIGQLEDIEVSGIRTSKS